MHEPYSPLEILEALRANFVNVIGPTVDIRIVITKRYGWVNCNLCVVVAGDIASIIEVLYYEENLYPVDVRAVGINPVSVHAGCSFNLKNGIKCQSKSELLKVLTTMQGLMEFHLLMEWVTRKARMSAVPRYDVTDAMIDAAVDRIVG